MNSAPKHCNWGYSVVLLAAFGCEAIPHPASEPAVRNPFPQLNRVAVAPFFNLSDEPTVDGRRFALAYFAELQATPGFEVVPTAVVETTMRQNGIELNDPAEARRLAELLEVDAVVVGAVTDYSPYYPPRCGLKVQWWAANPCFHPIPPGYGLPWCTAEEEFIPPEVAYQAEMAVARAQLAVETPPYSPLPAQPMIGAPTGEPPPNVELQAAEQPLVELIPPGALAPEETQTAEGQAEQAHQGEAATGVAGSEPSAGAGFRPDRQSFLAPCPESSTCGPSDKPVLTHTRIYDGRDGKFTEAMNTYYSFLNDARFGGWEGYLQRSEDFIRFCCQLHIAEMLAARGGADRTRVVWQWPHSR
jgi:hypothetical protein